jgi:protein SCO1/2
LIAVRVIHYLFVDWNAAAQRRQEDSGMPQKIRYGLTLLILSAPSYLAWSHGQSEHEQPMLPMEHSGHSSHTDIAYVSSVEQYRLPDVNLVNVEGQDISLASVLASDIPVMLNLIFTTCTAVCPVMSATFEQVRHELGPRREQLHMVSISIDPEHDTPERLREYATKYHADPMWEFYTGAQTEIIKLQRALEAFRGNKMNHIPLTYLRASSSSPWIRIEGFASAEDLINEYHRALEIRH